MRRNGRPNLAAHDCRYPLSRYTCRATTRVAADFLDFIAFCRCSTGVAPHPLKILVSHLPPPPMPREVSHRNLGLKRCRATRGVSQLQLRVSRYTVQLSVQNAKMDSTNMQLIRRNRTLKKHPFGRPFPCTTPSPLLWRF